MRRRSTCRRRIRNVVVTVTVAVAAVYTSICLCPYASVYYTGRRVFLPKCFESSPIETAARIKRGDMDGRRPGDDRLAPGRPRRTNRRKGHEEMHYLLSATAVAHVESNLPIARRLQRAAAANMYVVVVVT